MNVLPILFSGAMVSAILREIEKPGTGKTQTRRIVKPQPEQAVRVVHDGRWFMFERGNPKDGYERVHDKQCPYGQPGDLLWVKESWGFMGSSTGGPENRHYAMVKYLADEKRGDIEFNSFEEMRASTPSQKFKPPELYDELPEDEKAELRLEFLHKWWQRQYRKPSIHMPRWASRLTLELTDVRVERMQDISEDDARAEGITDSWPEIECNSDRPYAEGFRWLWRSINGDDSWNRNDWVWCLSFRPHMMNIDEYLRRAACQT